MSGYDKGKVQRVASGKWRDIVSALGNIPAEQLDGQNHPCPQCGGTDRFNVCRKSFDETGTVFCNKQCGIGGDGFHVLMAVNGWTFPDTLKAVADLLNLGQTQLAPPIKPKPTTKPKTKGNLFPTAVENLRSGVVRNLPPGVTLPDQPIQYRYNNADGSPIGVVVRWDRSDGEKEIRQLSTDGNGWQCSWTSTTKPLWKLADIMKAETVYVVEGEKTVEAVESFGLVATTSAGGSGAPAKSEWSVLDGKHIIIVPDHDEPGRKYRDKVIPLIQQQAPTATIATADLCDCWPEIPEAGDAFDWSEANDSKPPEWFRDELERITKPVIQHGEKQNDSGQNVYALPLNPDENEASVDKPFEMNLKTAPFQPFPVHELPSSLKLFCEQVANAIGCDNAFVVLPLLSVCAAAIGTSRTLMIKRGWFAPSILWTVTIGESGSQKSPPFRVAVKPVKDQQARQSESFASENAEWIESMADYKREKKRWDRTEEGERPQPPDRPARPRCMVQDTTIEALAPILLDNPSGVLLARDELSGWISSFDQHGGKGGASADAPKWLEIYNGESITVDRKTGDERFIFVPHPSISICGGIQPDILSRCLTDEHKANGLQSRLLMAYPPRRAKRWRDDEIPDDTLASYAKLVESLTTLQQSEDASGEQSPTVLRLTDEARQVFREFVNQHGEEQNALHGHLASQWSKLEEIPARLAIILHCVKQETTGVMDAFEVDAPTIESAIAITEWFKAECLRINGLLTEPEDIREARHMINWIHARGGRTTAREVRQNRRDIDTTEQADLKLIHLVSIGAGDWQDIHASREFVLHSDMVSTVDA